MISFIAKSGFTKALVIAALIVISVNVYQIGSSLELGTTMKKNKNKDSSTIDALEKESKSIQATIKSLQFDLKESIADAIKKALLVDTGYLTNGTAIFRETAESHNFVTDKVTDHEYYIMYGKNLLPYYYMHPKMKMLEIGLGCGMGYGPGASVKLWKELLPEADLWEAEYNGECVKKSKEQGQLEGLNTLVGDQGNPEVLDEWIEKSGGDFDVIIDDGGHTNCQIWTSFEKLWPTIKRGGLYFIEDMQVANLKDYKRSSPTCDGKDLNVPNKLKEIFDRLMYNDSKAKRARLGEKHTGDVEFLFCQSQACVLKKKV